MADRIQNPPTSFVAQPDAEQHPPSSGDITSRQRVMPQDNAQAGPSHGPSTGAGSTSPTRSTRIPHDNVAPSLTHDLHVEVGEKVILNGSEYDMGDAILPTYAWTFVAPPGVTMGLTSPDKMSPSFTPEVPGDYVASLPTPHGIATVTIHVTEKAEK